MSLNWSSDMVSHDRAAVRMVRRQYRAQVESRGRWSSQRLYDETVVVHQEPDHHHRTAATAGGAAFLLRDRGLSIGGEY
jgi:hypothetical protein